MWQLASLAILPHDTLITHRHTPTRTQRQRERPHGRERQTDRMWTLLSPPLRGISGSDTFNVPPVPKIPTARNGSVCVCVCVCVRERESDKDKKQIRSERERVTDRNTHARTHTHHFSFSRPQMRQTGHKCGRHSKATARTNTHHQTSLTNP